MLKQICWKCGKEIPQEDFYGQTRRYCEKCYESYTEEYKAVITEYSILKNRVMFERAMRTMEKACADMTRFKKFANAVMKHSRDNPEQYRSSEEMIAAVILLASGYDIRMNYKIGRHMVDILIPEKHIVLEIDGEWHTHRCAEDGKRDVDIRLALGKEWEVVRIPTKYIEEQPEKLPEAIQTMYDGIKEIRAKNNGLLPEKFSRRTKTYYNQNSLEYVRKSHVI